MLSDLRTRQLRAAVSDGASSSSFSGVWARLLAQSFAATPYDGDWAGVIERTRALAGEWTRAVFSRNLPWHAIERAKRGAFATIAAISIDLQGEGNRWSAFALGDSCVFQLREGRVVTAVPLFSVGDFGNDPALLSTDGESNEGLAAAIVEHEGMWQRGDVFLLATDAVAQAICMMHEKVPGALKHLVRICAQDEEERNEYFDDARGERVIKNDDIALLYIEMR